LAARLTSETHRRVNEQAALHLDLQESSSSTGFRIGLSPLTLAVARLSVSGIMRSSRTR
jgi:hypothetical protein